MCQMYYVPLNAAQLSSFGFPLSPLICLAGGVIKVKHAVQSQCYCQLVKALLFPVVMVFLCNVVIVGINLAFSS